MHVLSCAPAGWRPSTIHLGAGCLDLGAELEGESMLLADRRALAALDGEPPASPTLTLDGGEPIKTFAVLEDVARHMAQAGLSRRGRLVALGGGTIGDLGGLAASVYMRGIEHVNVPTTLLAMLDASVGGKTAVNLPEGKNLVGHFWPPVRVWIDPRFLATLSETEFDSGLGEALKMAIGLDAALFDLLESRRDEVRARQPDVLEQVLLHAVRTKIEIVEADPRETGTRRLLNLGHTLGHALEAQSDWNLPHGHAVARGLHFAVDLAERRGMLADDESARARRLLESYGFTATPLPATDTLVPYLRRDKKAAADEVQFVLPYELGHCRCVGLAVAEIAAELERPAAGRSG